MTNQHPITLPPELVQQLRISSGTWLDQITVAYRAGSDQQLEADCEWLTGQSLHLDGSYLRAAMRPKPPSLREQALQVLESAPGLDYPSVMTVLDADQHALIRRALEAFDD